MKKYLIVLLCALLMGTCCLAEENPFANAATVRNAIEIEIDGQRTPLQYDSSEQYSIATGGTVQASFYAYSENSTYLYELYMIFPDTVETGSTVTPEIAAAANPDCCVTLILSTDEDEQYFFAGVRDGVLYPSASAYTITFDSVTASGRDRTYTGRLTASLSDLTQSGLQPMKPFRIEDAPFSFTIALQEAPDNRNPFDEAPSASPDATTDPDATPDPDDTPEPTASPEPTPQTFRV